MKVFKSQKGQTLIELVVALAVGIIVVSALAIAILSSLGNAQFSRDQSLATSYAQQGMEHVRRLRDENWTSFSALNGLYCIGSNPQTPFSSNKTTTDCNLTGKIGSFLIREATIEPGTIANKCNSNSVSVSVRVKWSDGKCRNASTLFCHKVELKGCINNLYAVPTP